MKKSILILILGASLLAMTGCKKESAAPAEEHGTVFVRVQSVEKDGYTQTTTVSAVKY